MSNVDAKKNGFTLAEVLVVIVLISVLVAIVVPSIIAINNRINRRLLESKKDIILAAAELYGRDNPQRFVRNEILITVGELVEEDYIKEDTPENGKNCLDSYGCVIDPVAKTSLNGVNILIKKEINSIIAIWDGTLGSSSSKDLVDTVINQLSCGTITESSPCLYVGREPNNYLWYSGIMWRILGVYKIDGVLVVKMITDDNVSFESTTG